MSFTHNENFGIPANVKMGNVKYKMVGSYLNKDDFNFTSNPHSEADIIYIPAGVVPYNSNGHNFGAEYYNLLNKGKLCKAAGLTGAEKRACKKQIKIACKNRPLLGKQKKAAWDTCAASVQIGDQEVSQSQQELAALQSQEKSAGLSTGVKIGLGVGAFATSLLLMYVIVTATKKKPIPIPIQ